MSKSSISVDGFVDPPKKVREAPETDIEKYGCEVVVNEYGGIAYKFKSPGRNGVMDRIKLFPIPPEHREIVSRYITFVEYKKKNKVPRPDQVREIKAVRDLGFKVVVIDSKAGVDEEFKGPFNNRRMK